LFHQLGVGAIVDYIFSKDRCCENAIDLLCVDILQLPVEDKIIAGSPQIYRSLLAE
jgi:hypothetical protein